MIYHLAFIFHVLVILLFCIISHLLLLYKTFQHMVGQISTMFSIWLLHLFPLKNCFIEAWNRQWDFRGKEGVDGWEGGNQPKNLYA